MIIRWINENLSLVRKEIRWRRGLKRGFSRYKGENISRSAEYFSSS